MILGIFFNFVGVRFFEDDSEVFRVLISGLFKYFKIKGCDIVVKVIKLIGILFIYFVFVVKFSENVIEMI